MSTLEPASRRVEPAPKPASAGEVSLSGWRSRLAAVAVAYLLFSGLTGLWLGMAGICLMAAWTETRRDTDLADATGAVTETTRGELPADAPELRFTDVSAEAGIATGGPSRRRSRLLPEDTGSGLAWGDVDGDGDPDLFVVGFGGPNRLFENRDGRFTDIAAEAGVDDPGGEGKGASFADYDGDGDLDLYVTRRGPNRLYRNRGDGTFDEVAAEAGVDDPQWSTGAAWGDFDRDGLVDLYVGSYLDFDAGTGNAAAARRARSPGAGARCRSPSTPTPSIPDPTASTATAATARSRKGR